MDSYAYHVINNLLVWAFITGYLFLSCSLVLQGFQQHLRAGWNGKLVIGLSLILIAWMLYLYVIYVIYPSAYS